MRLYKGYIRIIYRVLGLGVPVRLYKGYIRAPLRGIYKGLYRFPSRGSLLLRSPQVRSEPFSSLRKARGVSEMMDFFHQNRV